jgi:hypothetical protein
MDERLPYLRTVLRSVRAACHAGANPKSNPVATVIPRAKTRTEQSTPISGAGNNPCGNERSPDIPGSEKRKSARRDADHSVVDSVERNVCADGGVFARETAVPEGLADQGDGRRPRQVFAFPKAASQDGLDTQDR